MAIKYFLVALLAVIAVQGLEAKSFDVAVNANVDRSLVEDFDAAIEKLKQAIENAIANGRETLNKLIQDVHDFAEKALASAIAEIKAEAAKVIAQIKEAEELAQQIGLDISECINEQQEAVEQLAQATIEKLHACVGDKLAELPKIHDEAMEKINESYEVIYTLVGEFEACADLTCKKEVAQKVLQEIFNVHNNVRALMAEALNVLQTAIPEIAQCIATEIANMNAEAQKIVDAILQCINDKIVTE